MLRTKLQGSPDVHMTPRTRTDTLTFFEGPVCRILGDLFIEFSIELNMSNRKR